MGSPLSPPVTDLVRPEVLDLPAYNSGLSEEVVRDRYGITRVVKLGSNENPLGAGPLARAALADLGSAMGRYSDPSSTTLRQALADHLGRDLGRIIIGDGSEDLIEVFLRAVIRPGDRLVTLRPAFALHAIYAQAMGGRVTQVPLRPDFSYDIDALVAEAAKGPRVIALANPSNPAGTYLDGPGLERLIEATPAETWFLWDEAYVEYARTDATYPDGLAILERSGRPFLCLRTFSKAFGLAGLRVGYGIAGNPTLVGLMDRLRTPFNINMAAQRAALAALADTDHLARSVDLAGRERARLTERLTAMGLVVAPSVGNFLFVDVKRPAAPLAEALLTRGVIIKPWAEPGYTTCLRVSLGLVEENDVFLEKLAEVLDQDL